MGDEHAWGSHGEPKPDAPMRGRKSRGSRPDLSVIERIAYSGNMTQTNFMAAVVKHFADKPGKQSLAVACRARKRTKKGLVCSVSCTTHCNNRQKKATCPWTGMATLLTDADEPAIRIRMCPTGTHAPDQKQKYGTLTHLQRMVAQKQAATSTTKTIQRLVQNLDPRARVPSLQLGSFVSRFRKQQRAKQRPGSLPHKRTYEASDFEYLRDRMNGSLGGSTLVAADDVRLRADDASLRCINLRMSPGGLCAPLISPKLLYLTLSLLPQTASLRPICSADGRGERQKLFHALYGQDAGFLLFIHAIGFCFGKC